MAAYQGKTHWETQKNLMLQNLIGQGKSPDEAQRLVAQITSLQNKGGNIPSGHPDSAPPPMDQMNAQNNAAFTPPIKPPTTPKVQAPPPSVPVAGNPAPQSPEMPPPSSASPEGSGSPSIFDNPDAVGSVLGMGGLNRQMAQAQAMRDKEMPGGRYVSGGRIYTASNPLEHAATAYGKYKGNKDVKRIGAEQTESKKRLIDLLRNKRDPEMVKSSTQGSVPAYGRAMA